MTINGLPDYILPSLEETIDLTLRLGQRTNPFIRCAGISLNTTRLDDVERQRVLQEASAMTGLPAADPMRPGAAFEAGWILAFTSGEGAFSCSDRRQQLRR